MVDFVAHVPGTERTMEEWRLLVEAEGRMGGRAQSLQAVADLNAGSVGRLPNATQEAAPFWGQIALNLLAADDFGRALTAADQAILLDPENVVYRNNRVVLLTRLGRDADARREWEQLQAQDSVGDGQ